ncbi:hypothetical protein E4T44_15077, partial [Aureobasidium sp. EXF-8845]
MYFPKGTILALYFQVFPRTMPVLRTTLYIVTGCTVLCCCATFGLDTFYCHNITDNWYVNMTLKTDLCFMCRSALCFSLASLEEGACSTFESLRVFQADWAMEFATDIFIFALPFPLLRHLQLRQAQFYGLLLTFALGAITIAVSLGRFIFTEVGKSWNAVYIWSMIQMTVAIIVVSLPALKSLLRRRN